MKNAIQEGKTLQFTAGADLTSGQGLLVGTEFGVVPENYANGDTEAQLVTEGVFELPCASAADIAVGDQLYWDVADDEFNKTASGNWAVAVAYGAAGVGVTTVLAKIRNNAFAAGA